MNRCQNRKHLNDRSICFRPPVIHHLIKSGILSFMIPPESGSEAALVSAAILSPAFPLMLRGSRCIREIRIERPYKDICDSLTPLGNILTRSSGSYLILACSLAYFTLVYQLLRFSASEGITGWIRRLISFFGLFCWVQTHFLICKYMIIYSVVDTSLCDCVCICSLYVPV